MEVGQAHRVNLVRGSRNAIPIGLSEGEACIFDQVDGEPEIARMTYGRFDGIVGDDSADGQRVDSLPAEHGIQIGSGKGAVVLLPDHKLSGKRLRLGLEVVKRLSRAIVRLWESRIVAHVNNRFLTRSPFLQERADILLRARIITSPPGRMIDGFLNIDDDQRSRAPGGRHSPQYANLEACAG